MRKFDNECAIEFSNFGSFLGKVSRNKLTSTAGFFVRNFSTDVPMSFSTTQFSTLRAAKTQLSRAGTAMTSRPQKVASSGRWHQAGLVGGRLLKTAGEKQVRWGRGSLSDRGATKMWSETLNTATTQVFNIAMPSDWFSTFRHRQSSGFGIIV